MFKIEVVAATPEEMAGKLKGLAVIYEEGARYTKHRSEIDQRDAAEASQEVEAPKRGRKAKPAEQVEAGSGSTGLAPQAAAPKQEIPPQEAKPVTIDDVRIAMTKFIDAAAVKSGKEETRREEFKGMLDTFGVAKLSLLPEDKWQAMIDLAGEKLKALG